jgi:hypothetical protein
MKSLSGIICGILLCATASFGIGLQHGVFRSQSTQGAAWQGTAVITSERFDITVYPDYLDVDLEWVFKVSGTPPDSFKNALEIVGNLNLDAHSTVVGLLSWYQGKILKGKLKTDSIAKQQYEKVVDRSSAAPPPPRDPVLFEYGWGEDNYYISIFPAVFDSTRRVRIRYLIPAFTIDGVNKIAYPYSFTANPVVTIKTGEGVTGYLVEADRSKKLFNNPMPIALDAGAYSFQAYRSAPTCQSISYIIPVLSGTADGSTIYSGRFSAQSFKGEMCHIAVMTAQQALAKASVKEDYVVLWRWNHPNILAKYARQIVEQSSLLKKFLATLSAADKRAALVISKEGEAPITFHLDKQGGVEFNRMLAFLDSLGGQTVIDPPTGPSKQSTITSDTAQEVKEFNNAIQAALNLFERDAASLKHLLILTAGPQLLSLTGSGQNFVWDSTIDIDMLSSYLSAREVDSSITMKADQAYWPSANITGFLQKYHSQLNVWATVGSGADTATIKVLSSPAAGCTYCTWQATSDMHVYSDQSLNKQIKWTILNGAAQVAEYTESPRVVVMNDSMQYARLIGSSSYLVPLAASMPTSIAGALGFVDKKYSLVALEEDALPTDIAQSYESQGVPQLNPEDIFSDPGEHMEPISDWLKAYPPQSMSRSITLPGLVHSYYMEEDMAGGNMRFAVINNKAIAPLPAGGNGQVLVMPAANAVYSVDAGTYPDYETAITVKTDLKAASHGVSDVLIVKGGRLFINGEKFGSGNGNPVRIALFTCSGKKINVWNIAISKQGLMPVIAKLAQGAYIARITCGTTLIIQRIIVK